MLSFQMCSSRQYCGFRQNDAMIADSTFLSFRQFIFEGAIARNQIKFENACSLLVQLRFVSQDGSKFIYQHPKSIQY